MTSDSVSIIIPCHNAERTIASSIRSALRQTWKNCQIIVINDGSTDGTCGILKKYIHHIHVISQPNRGASAARNAGLEVATGDWVQFLDADDVLYPDKIESQILAYPDSDLISGRWGIPFKSKVRFHQNPLFQNLTPEEWIMKSWNTPSMMQTGVWLVRQSLIEKSGTWNEDLTVDDDGEFFARLIMGTESVPHCSDARIVWRQDQHSRLSQRRDKRSLLSAMNSALLQTEQVLSRFSSHPMKIAASNRLAYRSFELALYDSAMASQLHEKALQIAQPGIAVPGGKAYRIAEKIMGWKYARRLQGLSYQMRDGLKTQ